MTHYSNITTREILNDPMPEMSLLEIISMLFTVYFVYRDFKNTFHGLENCYFLIPLKRAFPQQTLPITIRYVA